MVRNYKKKGLYGNYKPEVVDAAISAVKTKLMSVRDASKEFGIPPTTLHNWVHSKVKPGSIGRPPTLPSSLEQKVVDTAKKAADMGFGLSKRQLLAKTGKIVKSLKLETPFKNNIPGKEWFLGLKGRHPELSMKRPQKLSVTRARAMNRQITGQYFNLLKDKLEELKVQPEHIWNCDETNMQLEHNPKSVVGRKGSKIPGRVANSKESVSILGCGNAVGDIMSPMVIVKGKTRRSLLSWKTEDAPTNTKWAYQTKSYMDQGLGVEWFKSVFLKECGPQRPQLLIVDSHCSHEPLELLELAQKENITILSLPSHCTHYLQPWDRSMFAPLKNKYNTLCSEFMAENMAHNITHQTWPGLFCKAWTSAITPVNMVSGFAATGIHPFNPNAIPPQAYISAPIPSQVNATQNGDQRSTTSVPVVANTPETPQIIKNTPESVHVVANTPESVPVVANTLETPQVITNTPESVPVVANTPETLQDIINTLESVPVVEYSQNGFTGPVTDAQANLLNQSQVLEVVAEVHRSETESSVALELPFLNENGIQTITLPVSFDDKIEPLLENRDLSNISLEETGEVALASDLWNSDLEAMFLPVKGVIPETKRKSNASASRILTSSEVIQVKKEKEQLK